ncbi:MAG: hypothetical protein MOGMAGMI_02431 [Candidatus Omnitrophica bacterium]|nr:hypothetical protein [Candidatus Omnitrophota bacterium]
MSTCHDIPGLRRAGATIREISQLTGLSTSAVHKRLSPEAPQEIKPHRRKGTTERACMCCGKPFLSEGPHNRLCGACRNRSAGPYDTPATVRYR